MEWGLAIVLRDVWTGPAFQQGLGNFQEVVANGLVQGGFTETVLDIYICSLSEQDIYRADLIAYYTPV